MPYSVRSPGISPSLRSPNPVGYNSHLTRAGLAQW
jgi:hypothetical protein